MWLRFPSFKLARVSSSIMWMFLSESTLFWCSRICVKTCFVVTVPNCHGRLPISQERSHKLKRLASIESGTVTRSKKIITPCRSSALICFVVWSFVISVALFLLLVLLRHWCCLLFLRMSTVGFELVVAALFDVIGDRFGALMLLWIITNIVSTDVLQQTRKNLITHTVNYTCIWRVKFGLNMFYSEEKDWARHTTQQCPLQVVRFMSNRNF